MKNLLSLRLAYRLFWHRSALRKRHKTMRIAIFSIALSLLPLVLVVEVSEAMIAGILGRYMETASAHLRVFFSSQQKTIIPFLQQAQDNENISYADFEINGPALAFAAGRRTAIELRGVGEQRYAQDSGFNRFMEIEQGSFDLGDKQIVLGSAIAEELQVKVGDQITLLTAAILPNKKYLPKSTLLTVAGIVSSGYREIDRLWAFSNYALAAELLHPSSSKKSLWLKLENPWHNINLQQLREELQLPLELRILSWKNLSVALRQNFEVTRAILILAMLLIVFLAMSNVSSSLIMFVFEQEKNIGVLLSCGARSSLVMKIFLWIGGISCTLAIIPGLFLGVLLSLGVNEVIHAANIIVNSISHFLGLLPYNEQVDLLSKSFYLEYIPINIKVLPLVFIGIATLLLGLAASFFPAWRASKLPPTSLVR